MAEPYRVVRPQVSGQPPIDESSAEKVATACERERRPLQPRAVFVAHGMGQQVRFQTLDDLARGLCTEIERREMKVEQRTALTVRVGCERLQRLELTVKAPNGDALPAVHLYEAYWAPLTEGAIGLWQTVRFLLSGGWNGIRSDAKLHRFMFGKSRTFDISRWALALLFVVILTVIAVLLVGGTIAGVATTKFTFVQSGWVTKELVRDLTALFELLLGVIAAGLVMAMALIALGRALKKRERYEAAKAIHWLAVIPGAVIILTLWFSAYIAIPLFFIVDETTPFPGRDCAWSAPFCSGRWGATLVWPFRQLRVGVDFLLRCNVPELAAWWTLLGFAVAVFVYTVIMWLKPAPKSNSPRTQGGRVTSLVLALIAALAVLALCGSNAGIGFVTWLLLFAAVLFVRRFLIQYLGDVAIYVCSHLVDRFFDLRERIRTVVWSAARAVYAFRDANGEFLYDDIVVAGHSLGSAVVYDTLNRLINEDDLAGDSDKTLCCDDAPLENLCVLPRTRLLLTFGSPLDKFAFIFAERHPGGDRDALSTSKQPLIARERPPSFKWVNVYSLFDILGGSLEFYDTPEPKNDQPDPDANKNRIDNKPDPEAITPIAAHTEFWKNKLIYKTIVDELKLT
jgi:pimeloyl-ACP methyl ester carboxylesterase